MTDEASWALIGAVCGIAVAGAFAWLHVARRIDRALKAAFGA